MTPTVDPCYCTQAETYERLLVAVLPYLMAQGSEPAYTLAESITETVARYRVAQEEYMDRESP